MILLLGLACSNDPVVFQDSTDLHLDFGLTRQDGLNSPYVRGALIQVDASHRRVRDHQGWTIESSDPSVLSVQSVAPDFDADGQAFEIEAEVLAVGEGEAELFLVDPDGERRGGASAEVRFPDRVELAPHGLLMVDREDLVPERLGLLGGETSTLLARTFHEGRELAGNGVIEVQPTAGLSLEVSQSFLGEDRDWVLVTPSDELVVSEVALLVDGEAVPAVEFDVVSHTELTELQLLGLEEEDEAEEGQLIQVLAQPFAGEEPVFGGEGVWNLGGQAGSQTGDVLSYDFHADQPRQVIVNMAGLTREVTVHGDELGVRSSDAVGCSSTGRSPLLWGLLALPLIALRRRRARSTGG